MNAMITMKDFPAEDADVIRKVLEPVTFPLSEEDRNKCLEMRDYLVNSQDEELSARYGLRPGVGLAANQIGWDKQIFAIYIADIDEEIGENVVILDEICLNPKVLSHSVNKQALKEGEGCLSVRRDVPGFVPRSQRIRFEYYDLDGQKKEMKLRGYPAIVAQHELDHLRGHLFYDRINQEKPWDRTDLRIL